LKIDLNIAADDPAELLKSLPERRGAELSLRIALRVKHQHADPPHPLGLLRERGQRPCDRRATKQRDEIASLHCLIVDRSSQRPRPLKGRLSAARNRR
jgi:hypothetical protein